ncbi:MAG TPA: peptidylprolyl isomerase, partial [Thermoanaerobaculia bacterium]
VPADLDAAAESALFDRYVREVVAASIVTEGEMQKVYAENRAQFNAPEQAHLSIIRVLKKGSDVAAKESVAKVVVEVFSARTALASQVNADQLVDALAHRFAEIAARASDDPSAQKGGDLGWVPLHTLDPRIANAARSMKRGAISGILESTDAYQVILLHEYHPAGVEPYETAQDAIREFLMAKNSRKVLEAVKQKTAQLRAAGKVEVFAENLK